VGINFWFGLYAPPHTPRAIVMRLADALDATIKDGAYRKKLENIGAVADLGPDAFFERIKLEDRRWAELLPKMGFVAE
jgi:tripartite-type tricarboxylate transporter receptor subunit TctC